ncbi:hypothetical protein ACIRU3_19770 [Streptomyces sp. NPDC101151]|uniref:DUF4760 domain-containing protein n=1 Tax=Streptomyces sp. NPDC101151 TaxID=3366115 RepID=UPI00380B6D95
MLNSLNVAVSLLIAVGALAVAVHQVRRATRIATDTNGLSVFSALYRELRSVDFRRDLDLVIRHPPRTGLVEGWGGDGTPEEERRIDAAFNVCATLEWLGILVAFRLIDEKLVVSANATMIIRAWIALQPFIERERSRRRDTGIAGVPPGFMPFFEHLAARTVQRRSGARGQQLITSLRLETMPDTLHVLDVAPPLHPTDPLPAPRGHDTDTGAPRG